MEINLNFSFDVNPSDGDDFGVSNDRLPVGTIPIIATSSPGSVIHIKKFFSEPQFLQKGRDKYAFSEDYQSLP